MQFGQVLLQLKMASKQRASLMDVCSDYQENTGSNIQPSCVLLNLTYASVWRGGGVAAAARGVKRGGHWSRSGTFQVCEKQETQDQQTNILTDSTSYMHTYVHTYRRIHPSMHPCIHPSMHPCIHASIHPSIHPCTHACMQACLHRYTCMHACIHT